MANINNRCIIALPSVTYAMRSSELLGVYGITSKVIKLDSSLTKKGCANGIELNCRYLPKAKGILLNASMPISETAGG